MKLVTAQVKNFEAFGDSGEVLFSDGINLIIGQNNAGKSSFLRALLSAPPDDRHTTRERWKKYQLPSPEILMTISVHGSEIQDWLLSSRTAQIIPAAMLGSPLRAEPHIVHSFI